MRNIDKICNAEKICVHLQFMVYIRILCCFLRFTLFWCKTNFVAIYPILCGDKFSQKLYLWRKMTNISYECAAVDCSYLIWHSTKWVPRMSSIVNRLLVLTKQKQKELSKFCPNLFCKKIENYIYRQTSSEGKTKPSQLGCETHIQEWRPCWGWKNMGE